MRLSPYIHRPIRMGQLSRTGHTRDRSNTHRYRDFGIAIELFRKKSQKLQQRRDCGRVPPKGINHSLDGIVPGRKLERNPGNR